MWFPEFRLERTDVLIDNHVKNLISELNEMIFFYRFSSGMRYASDFPPPGKAADMESNREEERCEYLCETFCEIDGVVVYTPSHDELL